MTTQPPPTTYDILIAGGRVIDPARGLDGQLDVAIAGGRIARIEAGINSDSALRTLDASGRIVTPGLIDLHTHVAGGLRKPVGEDVMVSADVAGVYSGVTTVLDAGSTGALNVAGLINYTAALSKTRVLCLLNVGSLGVTRAPEVRHPSDVDHDASVAAILARPDVVRGVKVRMVSPAVAEMGMDLPRAAKAIASEAGVPMMVHVGDIMGDNPVAGELAPRLLSEVLTRGDIVTHTLSFHIGALLAGDDLLQEARDARERGVVFDVGVGKVNFSFDSAKKVLDQGF
ncbi:MAG: amidohydrolase family protein, partial [Dehalococcoidia bacterium]